MARCTTPPSIQLHWTTCFFLSFFPDPTTATTNASPSPALIRIRLVRTIFRCQRWNSKRPKRIFSQFAEKNKQTNKHTQRRSGAPGNFRRDEIFNSAATKRPVVARQFFVVVAVVFCCFFYIFTELLETRRPPAVVCCSVRAPPPPWSQREIDQTTAGRDTRRVSRNSIPLKRRHAESAKPRRRRCDRCAPSNR